MMGKKRRTEEDDKASCFRHLDFTSQTYADVVPYSHLRGCVSIVSTLEREIRTVLLNQDIYETSLGGLIPVMRFLRINGVKNSSKQTAVLSFASDARLDVFLVRTPIGFEPQKHLREIYKQAKELHRPVLVVLKNVDALFRHDKDLQNGQNYKRTENMLQFSEELKLVKESCWKIWTIMLNPTPEPFFLEIDKFFQRSTIWAGCRVVGDIFDDLTRSKILMDALHRYIPDGPNFPFDHSATDLLAFVTNFTSYCTYTQIEEFVRHIVSGCKYNIPAGELQLLPPTDSRLVPRTADFMTAVREKQTISMFTPYDWNVAPFVT